MQPDQVDALLLAAGKLDAEARERDSGRRRPLLATLTLAGLRIGEALDLRWRHVNLPGRKLRVPGTKTDAAARTVDLTPVLMELLMDYRSRARFTDADDPVFATKTGKRDGESNVRRRFLAPAVERANEALEADGGEVIGRLTPHSLRRTCASLLLAAGADVPYVMAQLGHSDPKMTLGVSVKVIATNADYGAELDRLIGHSTGAGIGTSAFSAAGSAPGTDTPDNETPALAGVLRKRLMC